MQVAKGKILMVIILITALLLSANNILTARISRKRVSKKEKNNEPILKIKLGKTHRSVAIMFPDGGELKNSRGRRIKLFRKGEKFVWTLPKKINRRTRIRYKGETLYTYGKRQIIELNKKSYRGHFQIKFSEKGATVVNHVGIENYLLGVVGSEIGSRSPIESLKTQTVIARTYAYASRGKHGSDNADVCNSTHCQVYSGISSERDTISPAVNATRGVIMISNGKPVTTLYHACCGGMTSDNDKVFGGAPRSYLRRVLCPFCEKANRYRWSKTIDKKDLISALRKEKIVFSKLYGAEIEAASHMDRVDKLILTTDMGIKKVKGTTIRRIFNLSSTTFTTGHRSQTQKLIAVAQPVKNDQKIPLKYPASILIAGLTSDINNSPQQLFIYTEHGLRRAIKPEIGWQTISFRTVTTASNSSLGIKSDSNNGGEKKTLKKKSDKKQLESLQLFGRGFGHQVGLCQSGAIELGKRNWSYRQILALYYSNVALRSLDY